MFSNRHLLGGIGFSLAFAAAIGYLPVQQRVFGTSERWRSGWTPP
ncbi:hypothetical protein ACFVVA_00670 [Kitasatospora sp. NPDC058048]